MLVLCRERYILKKIIPLFLLVGVLLQTFSTLIIIADYQLNKDFIAKNLCENRDKPQMHCNGKCHLMKQIEKDQKRDSTPVNNKIKFQAQFFSESTSVFTYSDPSINLNQVFAYIPVSSVEHLRSIFHPPCIVS
jgi:hypothetical protein